VIGAVVYLVVAVLAFDLGLRRYASAAGSARSGES
jgi:hypothetical protein